MTDGWNVGDAVAAQHRGGGSDAAASGDGHIGVPRPGGRPLLNSHGVPGRDSAGGAQQDVVEQVPNWTH